MHFHWQNLNERRAGPDGETPTGFPWNGRAFLHFAAWTFQWEWSFGTARTGVSFRHDDEGMHWMFAVPMLRLFVALEGRPFSRHYRRGDRELSLNVHDWTIWWNVWTPAHEWSNATPRHRNGSFHVLDFLLGQVRYTERDLAYEWVAVPMPERCYFGAAKLFESTWKRPRWFARRLVRCDIQMLPGEQIAHPGKGESSWDCDTDATFGWCGPADSVSDGVAKLVGSVLRSRRRHGGHNWLPRKEVAHA